MQQVINGQWIRAAKDWTDATVNKVGDGQMTHVYINLLAVRGLAARYHADRGQARYRIVALVDLDDEGLVNAIPLDLQYRTSLDRVGEDMVELLAAIAPPTPKSQPGEVEAKA